MDFTARVLLVIFILGFALLHPAEYFADRELIKKRPGVGTALEIACVMTWTAILFFGFREIFSLLPDSLKYYREGVSSIDIWSVLFSFFMSLIALTELDKLKRYKKAEEEKKEEEKRALSLQQKELEDYENDAEDIELNRVWEQQQEIIAKQISGEVTKLDIAIETNPNDPIAYWKRADYKNLLRDHGGAMSDRDKALSLDPHSPEAYIKLAQYKGSLEDYSGAIDNCSTAIELGFSNADFYYERAKYREILKDYHKARDDYSRAIILAPNNLSLYHFRSRTKKAIGDVLGSEEDEKKCADYIDIRTTNQLEPNTKDHKDKLRVMIINHNPGIQESIALLLTLFYDVDAIFASLGQEALEKLVPNLDMVIMDMRMPGMSGIELLERIKMAYPDLPVGVASVYRTDDTLYYAGKLGAFSYLDFFTGDALHAFVERGLRIKRGLPNKG